ELDLSERAAVAQRAHLADLHAVRAHVRARDEVERLGDERLGDVRVTEREPAAGQLEQLGEDDHRQQREADERGELERAVLEPHRPPPIPSMQVGIRLRVTPDDPFWPTWPASLSSVTSARGKDPLASANLNTWSVLLKNVCALARQVASSLVSSSNCGACGRSEPNASSSARDVGTSTRASGRRFRTAGRSAASAGVASRPKRPRPSSPAGSRAATGRSDCSAGSRSPARARTLANELRIAAIAGGRPVSVPPRGWSLRASSP